MDDCGWSNHRWRKFGDVLAGQDHKSRQRHRQPEVQVHRRTTTYVIDMTQNSPAWQQTPSMAYPRSFLNLTVLPDGSVLAPVGRAIRTAATSRTPFMRRSCGRHRHRRGQRCLRCIRRVSITPRRSCCRMDECCSQEWAQTLETCQTSQALSSSHRLTCSKVPRPTITQAPSVVHYRPEFHGEYAGWQPRSRRLC